MTTQPTTDRCCTIVPYFKIGTGNRAAFEQICERLLTQTRLESKCLYYGFSFAGDLAHCREGYEDAEGLLTHLKNAGPLIEEMLKISEITRLEVHGPETELVKLRGPMAHLNPQFFTLTTGFRR